MKGARGETINLKIKRVKFHERIYDTYITVIVIFGGKKMVSGELKIARQVCGAFKIPREQFRHVASRIMSAKDNSTLAKNLKMMSNMPKQLSNENILRVLNEENIKPIIPSDLVLELRMTQKELTQNKNQLEKVLEISKRMNDVDSPLDERAAYAVSILRDLFRKNGERINTSLLRSLDSDESESSPQELEIVATTKSQKEIDSNVNPKKLISNWVAQIREDVFVAKGKVFKGEKEMTEKELNELQVPMPELYSKIKSIIDNKNATFMCVPLTSGEDLLGIISVNGARLTNSDMTVLRTLAIHIAMAIKSYNSNQKIQKMYEVANRSQFIDQITKIYNRKYLDNKLPGLFADAQANGEKLSLLFIDVDGLKKYDDQDHLAGDYVLESIAGQIHGFLNKKYPNDILTRYGGDEFIVLLPNKDVKRANQIAEEIREYVSEQKIKFTQGKFSEDHEKHPDGYDFTLSIGVADNTLKNMSSHNTLIALADVAMYWRKRNGKNGVCMWTPHIDEEVRRMKSE
jgi:diguanylate cyclase (GGDEF)-like protein